MIPIRKATLLALIVVLFFPAMAAAMDPMESIKAPIDAFIVILNDPQYQVPGARSAQREAIWKTVRPMFDFEEVARRTVARHWMDFSESEKVQFKDVFAEFLGNTYIEKIQGEYHNEQIVYLGQDFFSDLFAEVKTQVVRQTLQTPVNYRMLKGADGQWRVYDVIVEGVSLVQNYRSQFASSLRRETPAQLIQRLSDRLDEQSQRLADPN